MHHALAAAVAQLSDGQLRALAAVCEPSEGADAVTNVVPAGASPAAVDAVERLVE
jgi:hypothetical protein